MGVSRNGKSRAKGALGYVLVGIALGAFALLFRAVRGGRTVDLDHGATLAIQRRQHPWFSRVMHLVSWPGFPPQSRIIPWLVPLGWLLAGKRTEALFQFLGWGTGVISFAVKSVMQRPRPDHPEISVAKANIGGTSFPSGHVLNYIGVYGMLAVLLTWEKPVSAWRKAVAGLLAALIALVGPSRMYLGHHHLTDITASYLLGGSYVFLLSRVYDAVKRRQATA